MCRISPIFFHSCAHVVGQVFRCYVPLCSFHDNPDETCYEAGLCFECEEDLEDSLDPEGALVVCSDAEKARRRWHFFRRWIFFQRAELERRLSEDRMVSWLERHFFEEDNVDLNTVDFGVEFREGGAPYELGSDELLIPVPMEELPEDKDACDICGNHFGEPTLENLTERPVRLPCDERHVFGRECIHAWFAEKSSCPTCRQEFSIERPPVQVNIALNRGALYMVERFGFNLHVLEDIPRQRRFEPEIDTPNYVFENLRHGGRFIYELREASRDPVPVRAVGTEL